MTKMSTARPLLTIGSTVQVARLGAGTVVDVTAAYVVVERTNRNGRTVRTAINPSLIK